MFTFTKTVTNDLQQADRLTRDSSEVNPVTTVMHTAPGLVWLLHIMFHQSSVNVFNSLSSNTHYEKYHAIY